MAGARLCFRINMQVCGFGAHGYAGVAANPCGGGCEEFAGGVGANFARSRQLVGCVGVSVVCRCRGAVRMGRDGLSGRAGKPLWHGRKGFRVCPFGPSGMAKGPVLRPGCVSVAGREVVAGGRLLFPCSLASSFVIFGCQYFLPSFLHIYACSGALRRKVCRGFGVSRICCKFAAWYRCPCRVGRGMVPDSV